MSAFHNVADELRFDTRTAGITRILADTNGNGVADLEIQLVGTQSLQAADFIGEAGCLVSALGGFQDPASAGFLFQHCQQYLHSLPQARIVSAPHDASLNLRGGRRAGFGACSPARIARGQTMRRTPHGVAAVLAMVMPLVASAEPVLIDFNQYWNFPLDIRYAGLGTILTLVASPTFPDSPLPPPSGGPVKRSLGPVDQFGVNGDSIVPGPASSGPFYDLQVDFLAPADYFAITALDVITAETLHAKAFRKGASVSLDVTTTYLGTISSPPYASGAVYKVELGQVGGATLFDRVVVGGTTQFDNLTFDLASRLYDRGGGLIYDAILNVTWLQDANYAKTSGHHPTGRITWFDAMEWVESLSYYDSVRNQTLTGWRLPRNLPVNGVSYNYQDRVDGLSDKGDNITSPNSELAHLFAVGLGNKSYCSPTPTVPNSCEVRAGWGCANTGPFVNIQAAEYEYMSGTDYGQEPDMDSWGYQFSYGLQDRYSKGFGGWAWPVRDGDVGTGHDLKSLTLKTSLVAGCKSVTGTVTLSGPAPAEGVVVTLADTLASASTPATLKILAGATSKTFAVKTLPVEAEETGTVSATLDGRTLSQPLTVRPMGLTSLTLTPASVVGSQPATGKATLECKAGPGAILVDLASSQPTVAYPAAANLSIPVGVQSQVFEVMTNPVLVKRSATISGTANGITKSKALTVNVAASVSPASLKFGNVPINTTSVVRSSTLYNKGTVSYVIDSIALTGTNAKYYAQTSDCGATLEAGASCTIGVTFTPTVAGSKSAKLAIATSATSTPLSVSLSGTGM